MSEPRGFKKFRRNNVPIVKKPIEVPSYDADGNRTTMKITIRKLSYWQAQQAKKAFISDAIATSIEMADLREQIQKERREEEERKQREALNNGKPLPVAEEPDVAAQYDRRQTLHFGIIEWDLTDELSNDNIDDILGEDEAEFIFRAIIALSERSAAEKKVSDVPSAQTSESLVALCQPS